MSRKSSYLVAVLDRQVQSHVEIWMGVSEAADAADWRHPIEEVPYLGRRKLDEDACLGMLCWG
ncbi:MAG: hypothetical protein JJU05_03335 [Verrucomicrobia bacterium]|nr:hypothetical protein [Verrucomicrobiota bacterium]MCH8527818.1 hypothetical protein [Kiritimatiellia bacterium]